MVNVRKKLKIKDQEIVVEYNPGSGELKFGQDNSLGTGITNANVGAFLTINSLVKALRDIKMDKIKYRATGENLKEAKRRDKFYSRVLTRLGYQEITPSNAFEPNFVDKFLINPIANYILKKRGKEACTLNDGFSPNTNYGTWNGPERMWIKKEGGLEKNLLFLGTIFFLLGIFFIYPVVTGNFISGRVLSFPNSFGFGFLILGLVCFYLSIK